MIVNIVIGVALGVASLLPLAWKWQLGLAPVAAVIAVLSAAYALALELLRLDLLWRPLEIWLFTAATAAALLAYRFYRDPERQPPGSGEAVVSPADGEVLYVRESRDGAVPIAEKKGRSYELAELVKTPLHSGDALIVGIALNFLDVHVNRSPIAGQVTHVDRHAGGFASLRAPEAVLENERATIVIENDDLEVAVVMIASRLVRRIVTMVEIGQNIACGQRLGAIRFGSQVDLVLPARLRGELRVAPGDHVAAGESVIVSLERVAGKGVGV